MRSEAVPPPYVRCFTEYLRAAGYYCTNNLKTDYNFPAPLTAWDECSQKAHWRNRPKGQPFFSVFNIVTTHESQIWPENYPRATAALPPEYRHDPTQVKLPPYYPDTPLTRRDWANYYDLVTVMDQQVGNFLRQLEEDGLNDDTVVFFWADHGRGLPRAKRWVYDASIHVPLIVRWPDVIPPGTVSDRLVSLMDLGPTVLSIAGVPVPKYMQGLPFLGTQAVAPREYIFAGRDRMDEAYDLIRAVRDKKFHYIRNFQACKPYAQYIDYMEKGQTMREMRRLNKAGTLVGPQKLFFLPEKPPEELYDVTSDPHQIHNLASLPEYGEVLKRMRTVLQQWREQTGDLGDLPEDELKERMRPGGVWVQTAAPVLSPAGGSFRGPVSVKIVCATEGASIAYTTEQSASAHWNLYTKEILIDRSMTLRVKACRLGYKDSLEIQTNFQIA